jgi:hypothetical protein
MLVAAIPLELCKTVGSGHVNWIPHRPPPWRTGLVSRSAQRAGGDGPGTAVVAAGGLLAWTGRCPVRGLMLLLQRNGDYAPKPTRLWVSLQRLTLTVPCGPTKTA